MMECPGFNQITVLKVKGICCSSYRKKLKKHLSRLDGVCSVDINPEKNLVTIRGRVDPNWLVKTVAKTGKYAEILSLNQNHRKNEENNYRHSCYHEDYCRKKEDRQRGQEEYRCEDYMPPFDEHICTDSFCRHPRGTTFHDGMCWSRSFHYGPSAHFPHDAPWPNRYNQWFMEEPPPAAYGGFGPRRPPQHRFEERSGCTIS